MLQTRVNPSGSYLQKAHKIKIIKFVNIFYSKYYHGSVFIVVLIAEKGALKLKVIYSNPRFLWVFSLNYFFGIIRVGLSN